MFERLVFQRSGTFQNLSTTQSNPLSLSSSMETPIKIKPNRLGPGFKMIGCLEL